MAELPHGTVAFLFTDIAGSTRLWQTHPTAMRAAYARHDAILRTAITTQRGVVYKVIGDAFQVAFPTVPEAVAAALAAQRGLVAEDWSAVGLPEPLRIRMAMHVGDVDPDPDGDYRSPVLNRLGRLLGAGHGGQILLSAGAALLGRDKLPDGANLRDLGAQRLKDLGRPEQVWQLRHPEVPEQFPPLATLDARPNNLPHQSTPLLGREQEVTDVADLLRRPEVRLLTLTGPGGTGKTRLSVQVAAEMLEEFADGVFFVDLSPLVDPELVPSTLAEVLGVREEGSQPLLAQLREVLAPKRLLLVLDNVEHVVSSAAPLVHDLLAAAPGLRILATSRVPLRLRAEREYPVPPLALPRRKPPPTLEQLTQFAAVGLFIARAQAVKPGFAVTNETAPAIAEICWRLDGLPLAIELAAARIRMLSPQAMLSRLEQRLPLLTGGARDLPARQQTLHNAIAWSYDLLEEEEQALFRHLAVFAGGASFEAVEAVANPNGMLDIFGSLERLVEHSLVRQQEDLAGEPRFVMLETICEFAGEQLEASGDASVVREQHALFFLDMVETAALERAGAQEFDHLETEHDNVRSALRWSLDHRPDLARRLARVLGRFWLDRGHFSEGRSWLDRVIGLRGDGSLDDLAELRSRAAGLARAQGDYGCAVTHLDQALRLYRASDHLLGMAESLNALGLTLASQGDAEKASAFVTQALDIWRSVGAEEQVHSALLNLGDLAHIRGDTVQAIQLNEEALQLVLASDHREMAPYILLNLGLVFHDQQELAAAQSAWERARDLARELGDRYATAVALQRLGDLAGRRGEHGHALRLIYEALVGFREVRDQPGLADALQALAAAALAAGIANVARSSYREGWTILCDLGDAPGQIRFLERFATTAHTAGHPAAAATLLGAAEALRERVAIPRLPREVPDHEQVVASLRQHLDDAILRGAWATGRGRPPEEAIAEALSRLAAVETPVQLSSQT